MLSITARTVALRHTSTAKTARRAPFVSNASPQRRRASSQIITRAGAPPPPPETVWVPTGVPLVDDLGMLKTIQESGFEAAKLIAIAGAAVFVGSLIFKLLQAKSDSENKDGFNVFKAAIASVSKPASVLLPVWGMIYSATVSAALAQVAATELKKEFEALCFGYAPAVLNFIKSLTQLAQDSSEIVIIVGVAWAAIELKDRLLAYLERSVFKGNGARLLTALGSLLNYLVYAGAFFASLDAFGINITPLLASTGGASLVVGLAAQSILGNVASAVTLYTSPPFAAGDSVKFLAEGALVAEGVVQAIEPMRTILRTKEGGLLYLNNSNVTTYMILNDSQTAE